MRAIPGDRGCGAFGRILLKPVRSCCRITIAEQHLLAAADKGEEKHVEDIRQRLDRLHRQFIYL